MTEPCWGTRNWGGGTKGLCFPLFCIIMALPQVNFLFKVLYHDMVQSHPLEEATESRLEEGKGLDRSSASVNRRQVRLPRAVTRHSRAP